MDTSLEDRYNSQFPETTRKMNTGGGMENAQGAAADAQAAQQAALQPQSHFPTAWVVGGIGFVIVLALLVYLSISLGRLSRKARS
jgi:hypothetical protein